MNDEQHTPGKLRGNLAASGNPVIPISRTGTVILIILVLLSFIIIFGSYVNDQNDEAFRHKTSAEKQDDHKQFCADFRREIAFKIYSELSQDERKLLASCGGR